MGRQTELLTSFYDKLLREYGPQHWWPGETPFEVTVGAILTQNTAWTNVEKAIANLKLAGLMEPRLLLAVDPPLLARLIRPAGTYNVKTKRLRAFLQWFVEAHDGRIESLRTRPLASLREDLLAIRGIGRETADSILLYAVGLPTFVIDAYTHRVLRRHGLVPAETDYEEMKALFEDNLPRDAALFNEVHALLVACGKSHCKPRPVCAGCPLEDHPHVIEEARE
jgi:endonuclease III related protein